MAANDFGASAKGQCMGWLSGLFQRDQKADEVDEADDDVILPASAPRSRRKILPRFRGSAVDQIRSGTKAQDHIRLRLRSAFTPSRPIMDATMFAGRTKLLESLIRSIEDQQMHLVLFGPRGIGKTSALHVLCSIAQEARYVVRYISCGERTDFPELFRAILNDIPLLYHENYDPTSDEIEDGLNFGHLLPDAPLTVAALSDVLAKISGTRLLIVLDEFDRAHGAEFRRSIAELIKNLSDRGSRVQLVIAGVAQNLNEIIEHIPSIRRNIIGIQLPNMAAEEIAELIANGQAESGMEFAQARRLIADVALGLPYLASLISQHAGLAALERDDSQVSPADVETAIGRAVEEIELRIAPANRHQIDRAFAEGRERELGLLSRVALQNSGRLDDMHVHEAIDLKVPAQDYLQSLSDLYGLIAPINDDPRDAYAFVDDGVPVYLWMRLMQDHVLRDLVMQS